MGIGAAGGKQAASAEGKKLDDRLKILREERAKRAPVMKAKEAVPVGASVPPPPVQPNMAAPQKPNRRKNKRKKGRR